MKKLNRIEIGEKYLNNLLIIYSGFDKILFN